MNVSNYEGRTALMVAARMNKSLCAQQLLNWGADVNLYDGGGNTALDFAAMASPYKCSKVLLQAGALVERKKEPYPPLTWLVEKGPPPIEACLELLIEYGANVNLQDDNGMLPLTWAAAYRNAEVLDILVRAGAYTEAVTRNRASPLLWAIMNSNPSNVTVLLQSGAKHDDESTIKRHGLGILRFTALLGSVEVMEALRAYGLREVNITTRDRTGLTPWEIFVAVRPVLLAGNGNKMLVDGAESAFRELLASVTNSLEHLDIQPGISLQDIEILRRRI